MFLFHSDNIIQFNIFIAFLFKIQIFKISNKTNWLENNFRQNLTWVTGCLARNRRANYRWNLYAQRATFRFVRKNRAWDQKKRRWNCTNFWRNTSDMLRWFFTIAAGGWQVSWHVTVIALNFWNLNRDRPLKFCFEANSWNQVIQFSRELKVRIFRENLMKFRWKFVTLYRWYTDRPTQFLRRCWTKFAVGKWHKAPQIFWKSAKLDIRKTKQNETVRNSRSLKFGRIFTKFSFEPLVWNNIATNQTACAKIHEISVKFQIWCVQEKKRRSYYRLCCTPEMSTSTRWTKRNYHKSMRTRKYILRRIMPMFIRMKVIISL